WRPIEIRHPVTKRALSDRFLIGELELVQVRPAMTLARVAGTISRPPAPGDVILTLAPLRPPPREAQPTPPGTAAEPPSSAQPSDDDPHAQAIGQLLLALRGAAPDVRARAYEDLADSAPESPYAEALRGEAAALRSRRDTTAPPAPIALRRP